MKNTKKKIIRPHSVTVTFSESEFNAMLRDMKLGEKRSEYIRRKIFKKE